MKSKLQQWRDSSAVIRFHTLRQIKYQTIAQHSHGVACLVMLIDSKCSAELLKAALTHDFHEQHVGDMPSTAKRMFPELGKAMNKATDTWDEDNDVAWNLSTNEQLLLKLCDYLELLAWSIEEWDMGNTYAMSPIINICKWLDGMEQLTVRAKEVYRELRDMAVSRIGDLEPYYTQEEVRT